MRTCSNCLLNDGIAGVKIDVNGFCNFCNREDNESVKQEIGDHSSKFTELIEKHKKNKGYDCVVAFSGGKDSTYTLHLIKNVYGLRTLAMSFDNWFQSEQAEANISSVVSAMNIDQIIIRPSFDHFRDIIVACLTKDIFPIKTLQRASAVCTICLSMIRSSALRIAIEKSIPFVVFGLSPGQAPRATAIVKTQPKMIQKMQEAIIQKFQNTTSIEIDSDFLLEEHFRNSEAFPYIVNPLTFNDYNEDRIYEIAYSYGWINPKDTDANSSNCLLNSLANEVHIEKYGFNPYIFEVSHLIRNGHLSKYEGQLRFKEPVNQYIIDTVKRRLNL